ncbi:DNA cross-link repair protein pso2/snm1 [Ephemerocybe angulata]|uniref:DNA cross-link repair protein pso2/snm1 n=1 Tax=Ephemerocybe angulata TaxID=980116 RepID=A0A8H6MEY4_9AGAR|nr:DNA cross-link repair protein pso2/snm1 [Tulosesus angulatus]
MKQKKKTSKPSSSGTSQTSVTLLDFFNPRPAAKASAQKGKARQDATKRKLPPPKQADIIVIDSDSEFEVEVVAYTNGPVKRRRLSPAGPANLTASSSSVKVEDATNTGDEWNYRVGPSGAGLGLSFGDPFLLTETRDPLEEVKDPVAGPSRPHPTPLQRDSDCSNPAPTTSEPVLCLGSSSSNCKADIDLTVGPWETGDDEFEEPTHIGDDEESQVPHAMMEDIESPEDVDESRETPRPEAETSNAYSVLMSGFKENQAWKEADIAEDKSFRPNKLNRRKAPFYKVLQGMPIAVDAFKYGTIPGVTGYFLTHAHSDHYTNLSSSWTSGPIYCSQGTANLIIHMLSVDKKWVHPLPMDTPTAIPDSGGVQVTLIEANHCPGSCLFLFEGRQTVNAGDTTFKSSHVGSSRTFRYLHCGDFRASPRHVLHPAVRGKQIDHVYLDTTYLDPKYTFPPQAMVISACADLASKLASGAPPVVKRSGVFSWLNPVEKGPTESKQVKDAPKPVLFVVGTYSIGKERIVKAVAKALNSKVYCDKRKAAILRCQADPELDALLTSNPKDAAVHLLPLGMINSDKLPGYFDNFKDKFSKVVGFRPTGWTYVQPSGTDQLPSVNSILSRTVQKTFTLENLKPSNKSTSTLQLYPVPYSEHSSFYELTCFAMSLRWTKMIATVNVGSEKSRAKMAKWVSKWEAERKKRGEEEVAHRHLDYW